MGTIAGTITAVVVLDFPFYFFYKIWLYLVNLLLIIMDSAGIFVVA